MHDYNKVIVMHSEYDATDACQSNHQFLAGLHLLTNIHLVSSWLSIALCLYICMFYTKLHGLVYTALVGVVGVSTRTALQLSAVTECMTLNSRW